MQNQEAKVNSNFNAALNNQRNATYENAYNDYTISQGIANRYIKNGKSQAFAIGEVYVCTPGTLTNQTIDSFTTNVNVSKNSVNIQIKQVRQNNINVYEKWLKEQEKLRNQTDDEFISLDPSLYPDWFFIEPNITKIPLRHHLLIAYLKVPTNFIIMFMTMNKDCTSPIWHC